MPVGAGHGRFVGTTRGLFAGAVGPQTSFKIKDSTTGETMTLVVTAGSILTSRTVIIPYTADNDTFAFEGRANVFTQTQRIKHATGNSNLEILPSGSGVSTFDLYKTTATANYERMRIANDPVGFHINIQSTGSGALRPFRLRMSDNDVITIGIDNSVQFHANRSIGFFGATPAAQQTLVTKTSEIHAALKTLGLIDGTYVAIEKADLSTTLQRELESKAAFSVVVFIEGTDIYALTRDGEVLSSGTAGTADTTVLQAALDRINTNGGGVLFIGPGTYILTSNIFIYSHTTMKGSGMDTTIIRQSTTNKDILSAPTVNGPHEYIRVQDLTLDTQTHNARACWSAKDISHSGFYNVKFLGGTNIFTVFWAGPDGATQSVPLYDKYNYMIHCEVYDLYEGDGLSWSFQQYGILEDIYEKGSRLAYYICVDCTVNNFRYEPAAIATSRNGIWVTQPCDNTIFTNLQINDAVDGCFFSSESATFPAKNMKVANSNFLMPGGVWYPVRLREGDDCRFDNCYFENQIPLTLGTTADMSNIQVNGCNLPQIGLTLANGTTLTNLEVHDCIFHAFTPGTGQQSQHIHNPFNATIIGRASDNVFENSAVLASNVSSTFVLTRNKGYVTENGGTATIPNGSTSVDVSHALSYTPDLKDIYVTPTNNLGNAAKFWFGSPTSTQFTISVDADPGAGTATFVWNVRRL